VTWFVASFEAENLSFKIKTSKPQKSQITGQKSEKKNFLPRILPNVILYLGRA
jgi:hypothetical protein